MKPSIFSDFSIFNSGMLSLVVLCVACSQPKPTVKLAPTVDPVRLIPKYAKSEAERAFDTELTKRIIDETGMNRPFADGQEAPLLHAAISGYYDAIKLLLANGAAPDTQRKEDGATALHILTTNQGYDEPGKRLAAVDALIVYKAGINVKNKRRQMPLHLASSLGDVAIMKRLIAAKADVQAKDQDQSRPLHYAAEWGNVAAVELLLKNGGKATQSNIFGETPQKLAAAAKHAKGNANADYPATQEKLK